MLSDASLRICLSNTAWVSFGASILATILATIVAVLLVWGRAFANRFLIASFTCLILVPVYVQATAWSAGFGIHGWWRLSQVDAARNGLWGLLSVIWIHASASLPITFLIIFSGLRRIPLSQYEQGVIERGHFWALIHVVLPRLALWIAGGAFWTFCTTQSDMVVTNLFQIPTLTESVYQQVQYGKLRSEPIAIGLAFSMCCGIG